MICLTSFMYVVITSTANILAAIASWKLPFQSKIKTVDIFFAHKIKTKLMEKKTSQRHLYSTHRFSMSKSGGGGNSEMISMITEMKHIQWPLKSSFSHVHFCYYHSNGLPLSLRMLTLQFLIIFFHSQRTN